jgi:hypothetical protein
MLIHHVKPAVTTCLVACILIVQTAMAGGKPFRPYVINEDPVTEEGGKKKKESKSLRSLENNAVKLYPDIIKREMHVVAKKNDGKEVEFFVFDIQGTLVQNYKMKHKDHYRIAGLKKGVYIYRVFCGDEEKATGKFEIR